MNWKRLHSLISYFCASVWWRRRRRFECSRLCWNCSHISRTPPPTHRRRWRSQTLAGLCSQLKAECSGVSSFQWQLCAGHVLPGSSTRQAACPWARRRDLEGSPVHIWQRNAGGRLSASRWWLFSCSIQPPTLRGQRRLSVFHSRPVRGGQTVHQRADGPDTTGMDATKEIKLSNHIPFMFFWCWGISAPTAFRFHLSLLGLGQRHQSFAKDQRRLLCGSRPAAEPLLSFCLHLESPWRQPLALSWSCHPAAAAGEIRGGERGQEDDVSGSGGVSTNDTEHSKSGSECWFCRISWNTFSRPETPVQNIVFTTNGVKDQEEEWTDKICSVF